MFDERFAEFSRERLGGDPVPDDLRVLLLAEWQGRTDFRDLLGVKFMEPGQLHPLLDTSYLSAAELADPEMQAVNAGLALMSTHVHIVAEIEDRWIGYWAHPDEPTHRPRPVVMLDTEFSYWLAEGGTLVEALAVEGAHYAELDERSAFARTAGALAELGLSLSTSELAAYEEPEYIVDPTRFGEELIRAERVRRGLWIGAETS